MHSLRWGLFHIGAVLQVICLIRLGCFWRLTATHNKQPDTTQSTKGKSASVQNTALVWRNCLLLSCLLIGFFALWERDVLLLASQALIAGLTVVAPLFTETSTRLPACTSSKVQTKKAHTKNSV